MTALSPAGTDLALLQSSGIQLPTDMESVLSTNGISDENLPQIKEAAFNAAKNHSDIGLGDVSLDLRPCPLSLKRMTTAQWLRERGNSIRSWRLTRAGGFYLVYVERASGASNVMLRRSADGQNFSQPIRVNDHGWRCPWCATKIRPRSWSLPTAMLTSAGPASGGRWKGDIRFARSTDGGKTFAPGDDAQLRRRGRTAGQRFSIHRGGCARPRLCGVD